MRLFINYAYSDKSDVEQVIHALREKGHEVGLEKLLPNQDWEAELSAAIGLSDAFIYALSPESVAVEWSQWAFAQAVKFDKPVIPLVLKTPVDVPASLSGQSWVDVSEGLDDNTIAPLLSALRNLESFSVSSAPVAPEHPRGIPAQAMGTIVPPGMRGGSMQVTED